ncbi:hypothetical protein U1Q18_012492, partial [Sarracenia purpurea var. burkii]
APSVAATPGDTVSKTVVVASSGAVLLPPTMTSAGHRFFKEAAPCEANGVAAGEDDQVV